jgi:hypothetical protein
MAFRWASDQPHRAAAAARLKDLVRETLSAEDELVISVSELDCAESTCGGGKETVVLLLWPNRSEKIKVREPMELIEANSIVSALRAVGVLPA